MNEFRDAGAFPAPAEVSVIRVLRALDQALGRTAEVLTAVSVLAQTLVVLAQVVCRYALKSPLIWADELARYLLVFMSFMGGYAALRRGLLATVDVLGDRLNEAAKRIVSLVACLFGICLLMVVVYYGGRLVVSPSIVKQLSPAMRLPMYWIYGVVPLSAAMMIVHLVVAVWGKLQTRGEKGCSS